MNAFFESIMSESLVKAIYQTLIHSLWQGALISIIAGIIMLTTKKSSAVWRYNLLLGSLLLFVICAAGTFVKQSERFSAAKVRLYSNASVTQNVIYTAEVQKDVKGLTDQIISFFNTNADAIVIFWFLIICFKCAHLLIGLSATVRLKKYQVFPAGDYWERRLKELSAQLGINEYIRLAQSGLAKVPLTIGYFKPVILIPVGMLAAIPQDQIEAILLHELAHIRRKDYLVNILQSLVEILFFFNPAIWWLSSLLRTERENCCDDLAIAKTANKTNYIKALVSFEEYQGSTPQYASAITGSKNHLLNRAKRLIYNHNKTLNPMEKIILTCGLVVTGMLTLAFTQVEKHIVHKHAVVAKVIMAPEMRIQKSEKVSEQISPQRISLQDTTKKTVQSSTISSKIDGKMFKIVKKDGKITELYIDNVRVPDDKIADYKEKTAIAVFLHDDANMMAEKAKAQVERQAMSAEDSKRRAENLRVLEEAHQNAKQSIKASNESKVLAENKKMASADVKKQAEVVSLQAEKVQQMVRALEIQKMVTEKKNVTSKLTTKQTDSLDIQLKKIKVEVEKLKIESEKIRKSAEDGNRSGRVDLRERDRNVLASRAELRAPRYDLEKRFDFENEVKLEYAAPVEKIEITPPVPPVAPYNVTSIFQKQAGPRLQKSALSEKVVAELISEGIIKDHNVSLHLTNDALTVDGVKQSDETLKKVFTKTGISSSDKVDLTYTNQATRSETK